MQNFDFMHSGTIEANIDHRHTPCRLEFTLATSDDPTKGHSLSVEVTTSHVTLKSLFRPPWPNHANVIHAFEAKPDVELTLGIGPNDTCDVPFWISFDARSYGDVRLYYGKGERRLETRLIEFKKVVIIHLRCKTGQIFLI